MESGGSSSGVKDIEATWKKFQLEEKNDIQLEVAEADVVQVVATVSVLTCGTISHGETNQLHCYEEYIGFLVGA